MDHLAQFVSGTTFENIPIYKRLNYLFLLAALYLVLELPTTNMGSKKKKKILFKLINVHLGLKQISKDNIFPILNKFSPL